MDINIQPRRQPAVLGQLITDPAGWTGEALDSRSDWVYELSSQEVSQLVDMANRVEQSLQGDLNGLLGMSKDDFALGPLSLKLAGIRDQLSDGLGAALVRGLPMQELSQSTAAIIYWAIGSYFGLAKSNNAQGDMLGHVTDLGKSYADPETRGYQTREGLDYHCDNTTVVGLMCVRPAQEGGRSKIASSVTVYNELLRRSPESVAVLSEPFYWTRHGEVNPGESPFYTSPVFNVLDDKLCVCFSLGSITKGHELPGAPALSEPQKTALALVEQIAQEQHCAMELRPGDMQFLNNYVVLHTRTAYTDWPEETKKRLLWRLWLSAPDMRPATEYVKLWERGVRLGDTSERIVL